MAGSGGWSQGRPGKSEEDANGTRGSARRRGAVRGSAASPGTEDRAGHRRRGGSRRQPDATPGQRRDRAVRARQRQQPPQPRNRRVAEHLQRAGLGTLLLDLLTADEEQLDLRSRELRFDIGLLAGRLIDALDWLTGRFGGELRVGLFGASTGAAAALVAAAERPNWVATVVSRSGRPDLAGPALERVTAPTLLIVGGTDTQVLALNRQAAGRLTAPHRLEIVPGTGHLFEEPGALDAVARLAAA
jgi:putative phosphoribosyl transferase